MNSSDLAIVTPSVTLNEVMYLEIPFIAIKTEDNQQYMYDYLKSKNLPILKKLEIDELVKFLKGFLYD
jgi:spore coat polysaccharide biosynthesis predicted glycosyltransferase SpsG